MTEEEYKTEWLKGLHQSSYNSMRFSDDRKTLSLKHLPYSVNIEKPENLRDYILKDMFDNPDPIKSEFADKIGVYSRVPNSILIPKLYSKYTKSFDVEILADLTKPLIVKCNHGSGWNIIITNDYDPTFVKNKIDNWLNLNYAYISPVYEQQYETIKPGVLIQPLLIDKPLDWQLYYLNGKLEVIEISRKINKSIVSILACVDENGKKSKHIIGGEPIIDDLNSMMLKSLSEIRKTSDSYGKVFDFVRMDYFFIDKPYLCEFTFSPSGGMLDIS